MAKLIVQGSDGRREFELEAVTTIGRHPDNLIQILDRIVSKEHAQIVKQPNGRFVFRDLGSLNGSFYRGERISEHVFTSGDELTLGSTQVIYQEQAAETAPEADLPSPAASQRAGTPTAAQRVMIGGSSPNETLIRQKLLAGSREFLPEKEITDLEVLRRDYEKLRLAHELGKSIGLEVNLDLLLEKIIMKAFELIPCDRGVILIMENGVPRPRVAKTRDGRNEQIVLSRAILSEVVQHKTAVLSSDATMDSRFSGSHSIILSGMRSTMTVPLVHHDELLGIMHLDSMVATNAFGEKDLQLFSGIGSQAAIAIHNSMLAQKIEQEAKTRAQFQRLLSPNLVEQVVAGKLQLEKGGALSEITLLFSDIRGFTPMSESRPPHEIVTMLNEYFELMVDVLFKHQGTLDKFVGDEIIALFGAPVPLPDAELKAVECALEMQKVLKDFNRRRLAAGQEEIKIGIGINTGHVVTGAIGSSRALQYTAIGDAMNVASRLCSAAKADQIIVSHATYSRVEEQVAAVTLPPIRLKGKSEEQRVYNVVGLRSSEWDEREKTRPF